MEKTNKKKRVGVVVGDKMNKTRVVKVEQVHQHPVYLKTMRSSKKYKVHDENNQSKIGDQVEIIETRPISKEKNWIICRIIKSQGKLVKVI